MWRIGIVGLGRASTALLPSMLSHPEVEIVALCEPQDELRQMFLGDFGVRGHVNVKDLCADQDVDVVYIASPHQFHREHAVLALSAGKHVLVEKPMALSLGECDEMIEAADDVGLVLMVGHTNGYDAPILALRELAQSRKFGRLRMINTMNYNDFLYRPRRPEELDTTLGGGIMYNQFPHQVEMVRTITNSRVERVSAVCGVWDEDRPTEGAVASLIRFENDVVASLVYSGYAHLDGRRLYSGLDNFHQDTPSFVGLRKALRDAKPEEEAKMRTQSGYPERRASILGDRQPATIHERFGALIAGFEHADVVPSPTGLLAYTDDGLEQIDVPFGRGGQRRATVIDELVAALNGKPPIHDGRWARTTLAICLAAIESSVSGREIALT